MGECCEAGGVSGGGSVWPPRRCVASTLFEQSTKPDVEALSNAAVRLDRQKQSPIAKGKRDKECV